MMELTVNGKKMKVKEGSSVSDLLSQLSVKPETVVVELNLAILKRARLDATLLKDKDTVEIVRLVGGG